MTGPTYPPANHLLRDLAVRGRRETGLATNHLISRPGLVDGAEQLRLGVLATLVDMTGAAIALATVNPDWIATADLSCHLSSPLNGDATVVCRPLRAGSSTVVVEAEIADRDGRRCGHGRMAFSRIPGRATRAALTPGPDDPDEPTLFSMDGGTPIDDSVLDRCGVHVLAPGRLVVDKSPYVQNSFGTVNGGVQALVAEAGCGVVGRRIPRDRPADPLPRAGRRRTDRGGG